MKENIEDDIRNAEHFISSVNSDKSYKEDGWHGYDNTEIVELARMLEYILSEYKNIADERNYLLAENQELKQENEKLTYARNWYFEHTVGKICTPEMLDKILRHDYISKQKIKNKIELLEEKAKYEQNAQVLVQLYKQIKVLKELL